MSTSWNVHRHRFCTAAMLEEIIALGFEWVELSHGIHATMMAEISKFVDKGKVRISSLHNFCPVPMKERNLDVLQFISHREEKRNQAIFLTQKTIDYAASVGAGCVILPFGKVHNLHSYHHLRRLALQGKLYTKKFAQAKIREILCRERYSSTLEERAINCLLRLGDYASAKGVRLGIKNCKVYEAFPSERELLSLLEKLGHPTFGYWHDFGCAQIKEHFTLLNHQEWLDRIGDRAIGSYVHDVQGLDCDNLPPFSGVIDYLKLVPLLPKHCIFVLKLKGFRQQAAIRSSFQRWKNTFLTERKG